MGFGNERTVTIEGIFSHVSTAMGTREKETWSGPSSLFLSFVYIKPATEGIPISGGDRAVTGSFSLYLLHSTEKEVRPKISKYHEVPT